MSCGSLQFHRNKNQIKLEMLRKTSVIQIAGTSRPNHATATVTSSLAGGSKKYSDKATESVKLPVPVPVPQQYPRFNFDEFDVDPLASDNENSVNNGKKEIVHAIITNPDGTQETRILYADPPTVQVYSRYQNCIVLYITCREFFFTLSFCFVKPVIH